VALCRCEGETEKPFCDGTHSKIGFVAAQGRVVSKIWEVEREKG
jgi:CDGSH-type Zn-finger protein